MRPLLRSRARALLAPLLLLVLAPAPKAEELVLTGVVLDRPGPGVEAPATPAPGLELTLELRGPGEPLHLRATTDAQGRFELAVDGRGARPLRVFARAPADATHRGAQTLRTLEPGEGATVDLRLVRSPHGALEGRVRDVRGRPLAGARIIPADEGREAAGPLAATDGRGRFRADAFRGGELRVELEGYAPTDELEPRPLARGGWEPLELTLASAGTLALRVVTASGAGVPELELELRPSDPRAPALERWDGTRAWRWTGADGEALFDGVWAETPLELTVWSQDGEEWLRARRVGDALVPASHPDGRPIELEPGARTELELRLGRPLRVRGRVLARNGRPLERRCYAHVVEVDPPADRCSPTSDRRARLDDEGRFELQLYAEPGLGRLLVTVSSRLSPRRDQVAVALVDPRDARDGVLELELVGAEDLSLRGRILGLGAHSDEYVLRLVPAGLSRLQADEFVARDRPVNPFSDGAFVFERLPWGRYDLLVQERTGCIGSIVARFPELAAGGDEVELELARPRDVRVRVRALAPGAEVLDMVVLAGRCFPVIAREPEPGRPSSSRHYADPDPWPAAVQAAAGDITTVTSRSALTVHRTFRAVGATLELPATDSGWYVLGVHARDEDKRYLAPVATPPIALGPGFHEIALELRRTASLAGRVAGGEPDGEDLYVELRDARDRIVTARRSIRHFTARMPVQRDGDFELREVPLGRHRLWVGTEAELDEGRFRRERIVDVREDAEPVLVRLPGARD